jgi:hypothetical protein
VRQGKGKGKGNSRGASVRAVGLVLAGSCLFVRFDRVRSDDGVSASRTWAHSHGRRRTHTRESAQTNGERKGRRARARTRTRKNTHARQQCTQRDARCPRTYRRGRPGHGGSRRSLLQRLPLVQRCASCVVCRSGGGANVRVCGCVGVWVSVCVRARALQQQQRWRTAPFRSYRLSCRRRPALPAAPALRRPGPSPPLPRLGSRRRVRAPLAAALPPPTLPVGARV